MTIDRYVSGAFLRTYIVLLVVLAGIYVFADIIANLDDFTRDKVLGPREVLRNMLDYYGSNVPLYYQQLGGITLALAAAFTFAMLLRNNELTPLIAAGMPLQRLALPVLLWSVPLTAAWMANSELVVPRYATLIVRQRNDLSDSRTTPVKCVRDDRNTILTADELHLQDGWMKGVFLIEPPDAKGARTLVRADIARWDPERRTWLLERGARQEFVGGTDTSDLGESVRWAPLDEYPYTLTPGEILLRQSSQWTDLMSMAQMGALMRSHNLPNLGAVVRARDVRFAQPLLAWIMLLLAVPFFLTREPGNVLVAGGKALLLCGTCFGFIFLCHDATDAAPLLAAAMPVLVFAPIAVVHFADIKT